MLLVLWIVERRSVRITFNIWLTIGSDIWPVVDFFWFHFPRRSRNARRGFRELFSLHSTSSESCSEELVGHPLADSARDPREPFGPLPLQEPLELLSPLLSASPLQGSSSFWLSS